MRYGGFVTGGTAIGSGCGRRGMWSGSRRQDIATDSIDEVGFLSGSSDTAIVCSLKIRLSVESFLAFQSLASGIVSEES